MFTVDWFSRHIPKWEVYLQNLKDKEINYLEIGCFEGKSTLWVMNNFNVKKAEVIDTFEGSEEHPTMGLDTSNLLNNFQDNLKDHLDKIIIHKGYSQYILPSINGSFDLIYIDGSHQSKDVFVDAYFAFNLLKSKGIMIFDDYLWKYFDDDRKNPKMGIDGFLHFFKDDYSLMQKGVQVILEKN